MSNPDIIIDTNIFIAFRGGIEPFRSLIANAGRIYVPVIVLGELLYGAHNSMQQTKNREAIEILLDSAFVIDIDEKVASFYAEIRTALKKNGTPIPENDMWIAAICKKLNLPLLTQDKHFEYIKGIDLVPIII